MGVLLSLHIVYFFSYLYSLVYDVIYIDIGWRGYGGKFKYLTFLNLVIQTFYFGVALANDIWGSNVLPTDKNRKRSKLQNFMNTFLASIVYPVGTFVVMTFWGIYAVDRELVFPKRLDKIIPFWLNHVEHTTVFPILLLEKYLVYHEYPSRRRGMGIMLAFANAYLIWILWVAYYADIWVYPVLQVMEAHQRAIFIFILMAFFVSIYLLGETINKFIWRKELSKSPKKVQTKKIS